MSNFCIENRSEGYVVCWRDDENYRWLPLRNFGDRQSDAIEYRDYDCPKFEIYQLASKAKSYSPNITYKRIKFRHYVKQ